jgi:hypothetical protein
MADFLATADSGSPVAKAELDVMNASFKSAQAMAQMQMGGPDALAAFRNMAEASGLGGVVDELLAIADDEGTKSIFEEMFSDEVKQSIKDVGEGLGIVEKSVLAITGSGGADVSDTMQVENIEQRAGGNSRFGGQDALTRMRVREAMNDPMVQGWMADMGLGPPVISAIAEASQYEGFEGMWSGGVGSTTYDHRVQGDVNIVVATSSDIETVQKIAQQINAATATGILGPTGAGTIVDTEPYRSGMGR